MAIQPTGEALNELSGTMQLSVVIPTYNRCGILSRTLSTVLRQTCPSESYEVIVVVDGSTDGTAAMLRQLRPACRFLIFEQPNRGQAAARNVGLKAASGDLVLFLDDDLLCDQNLFKEHIGAHRSGANQLVLGPLYVSPESPSTLATRWKHRVANTWIERLRREGHRLPVDALVGPNGSAKRETLLALGGFDERVFKGSQEDFDFGLRMWLAGVSFRFHGAAITHQLYIKSTRDFVHTDAAGYGRSEIRLWRKHPQLRKYSEFARYSETSFGKRALRELAARVPITLDLISSAFYWLAERFPENARLERVGMRFLSHRNIVMLRNAVDEAGGWTAFKRDFAVELPVLLYHNVGTERLGSDPSLTVSIEAFDEQIRWLKRHGHVGIRPSDWHAWCHGERVLPEKPVMVTFDDAYSDLATYGLPILKKYGFTATVFVVTSQIGGTNAWDERNGSAKLSCMTADQIRRWAAEGIEFGAHSRTHADLTALDDVGLESEVDGSARELSAILGQRVRSFAYPYGSYSEKVKRRVEKVFDLAFTCEERLNGLGTDPCLLHRTMVRPKDTQVDFAFYVRCGSSPLNSLRRWWHQCRLRNRLSDLRHALISNSR